MTRRFLAILLIIISFSTARAQNLKGIWTGSLLLDTTGIDVINTNYILHITEQYGNVISGKAFVVERRFAFEGILDFIGVIKNDRVKLTELKIRSSKVPDITRKFYLCIKNLDLQLTASGGIEQLRGKWRGVLEDHSDCLPANAILTRYTAKSNIVIPQSVMNRIMTNVGPFTFLTTTLAAPVVITVNSRTVRLSINDYLKEDNDTITVYQNRRQIIRRQEITNIPYTKTVRFDEGSDLQEIILYADNLGLVPPNTSTLTIDDGVKSQKVSVISTRQVSAVIHLKYEPAN